MIDAPDVLENIGYSALVQGPSTVSGGPVGTLIATGEALGVGQAAQSIAPALVTVANPDVIRDTVLVEVKKLLDFYGHDIPIWDEIVALAKKV